MTTNENSGNTSASPALTQMISKLDNRRSDAQGYVTNNPELVSILKELSPSVPLAILQEKTPFPDEENDYVCVQVKLSFMLSRSELAELQARADQKSTEADGK